MLGKFLEISIHAPDVKASYDFYESLGFRSVEVGEVWSHHYAVMSDGRLFVGLHAYPFESPALTFVRPELGRHSSAFKALGIDLEFEKLSEDEFNELGFLDPSGQMITLLEARTFSPPDFHDDSFSLCGDFMEFSRGTAAIQSSVDFWEQLGLLPGWRAESPHPWVRLVRDDINLGFHLTSNIKPGLSFFADDMDNRIEYLRAAGYKVADQGPFPDAATLTAPEGTPLYLFKGVDHPGAEIC